MFCLMMLALLRSPSIVSLPFQPQHQSMAASFHGSANIRCVSSPSGGLSSRRAYLSTAALFGFHGRSNIYYFISFDSSSTVLGYLRSGLVSEVSGGGKKNYRKQGHLHWNLPHHRWSLSPTPPPILFLFCCGCASAFHDPVWHFF